MSVALYMDVHVPRPVTRALRRHEVDVLTAQEDGTTRFTDDRLLDRAILLKRVLFSQDTELLAEAARRQRQGRQFIGIIYAAQLALSIGQLIEELELLARAGTPEDLANRVTFLPLR